jgi:hypothetical protein
MLNAFTSVARRMLMGWNSVTCGRMPGERIPTREQVLANGQRDPRYFFETPPVVGGIGQMPCRDAPFDVCSRSSLPREIGPINAILRLWLASVAALLAACATPNGATQGGEPQVAQQVVESRNTLTADVRACSAKFGFDPATATGLAETELAPQELKWRQCAYDAARRYIDRNPPMRSLMEQLIAEDIRMTAAIQQGTLTRSERRSRVQEMLGQLRDAEQKQVQAASAEQERKAAEMSNVVEGIRGLAY